MTARAIATIITSAAACIALVLMATPAASHAFGARYDLPLPLWLYLVAAGAAVALTFVVMALFVSPARAHAIDRELSLLRWRPDATAVPEIAATVLRITGVAIFLLVLASGFAGSENTLKNFAPTLVWVIWWVGFAFMSVLIGDLWRVLNPWNTLFLAAERCFPMLAGRPYPQWLGMWPAVLLFAIFAWLELVSDAGQSPRFLASLIAVYSLVTWAGMAWYGRRTWLVHGEAFTLAFGLFARFAPFSVRDDPDGTRSLVLRPFAAGLVVRAPIPISLTAFTILMLSTVTFDGIVETPAWQGVIDWASEDLAIRPLLLAVAGAGIDLLSFIKTAALIALPAVFFVIYWVFAHIMAALGRFAVAAAPLGNSLVLSLVPIAIAYHLAHYLSYLLLAGQLIVPLASDPFGYNWDLFGTAGYGIDITVINAKTVWYTAVAAIVAGHVIAVYIAHVVALDLYRDAKTTFLSQLPMLVLMVGYTMISLWILSQPIVEG